jgi:DNA-binding PadR family transcriptional regulator
VRRSDGVKFAILGIVACNSEGVHGYALREQCVRILGDLWQLSLQEVYRSLRALAADGWIEADAREAMSIRRVYCITQLGRTHLDAFLLRPEANAPAPRRNELAAKLLFTRPEQVPELLRLIAAKRDMYQQQLVLLATRRRRLRRMPVDPFLVNLLIDGEEGSVLAEIEWLNNVCEKLRERFGVQAA